jgi:transposase
MEERLRFVARLLDGEAMTDVCREFGISRKTGYKIFDRYKQQGLEALSDRSRRPVRYANQLPDQIETLIVQLKAEKPYWGARKIRELLVRRLDGDIRVPAKSTIHAVLDRHGMVKRGGGPRHRARGTPLSEGTRPNELWCADFIVVIAGCVDGLLPAEPESGTPIAQRHALLEEQRRLFYVGITRVKAVPSSNRPGSLLLTGSRTMTLADAMQSGIQPAAVSYGIVNLHLSRFIPELGPTAPAPIAR